MVAGQYGVESLAVSLMTPPNGAGGAGSWLPGMVVVALGEPGTPVVCWALSGKAASRKNRDAAANLSRPRFLGSSFGAFIGVFWSIGCATVQN